jgi:hypothetical protein
LITADPVQSSFTVAVPVKVSWKTTPPKLVVSSRSPGHADRW